MKDIYDKVNLNIKVLAIMKTGTSTTGANIQEVLIADATGACRCSLWETFIRQLEVGHSYRLCDFYIQEYRNKKGVSNAQQGSTIEPIVDVDIGNVSTDDYTNDEEGNIKDAITATIPKLERYKACIQYKTHRVEPLQGNQGRCTNQDCLCPLRYDFCRNHIMAQLKIVSSASPTDEVSVMITNNNLKDLLGVSEIAEITEDALLNLPVIKSITYDKTSFNITTFTRN